MKTDFNYEIQEHIGTVSSSDDGNRTLEVNIISFEGSLAKVDIRRWNKRTGHMLKGIAVTKEEAKILCQILQGMEEN